MSTRCAVPPRRRLLALLALPLCWAGAAVPVSAQVRLYERPDFDGRHFSIDKRLSNLERTGFNERAASLVVSRQRWEVCEGSRYRGHCMVLVPGRYPSLDSMGMRQGVSSIRIVADGESIAADRLAPGSAEGGPPLSGSASQDSP